MLETLKKIYAFLFPLGNPSKVYEVVYQTGSETHSDFYDIVLVATPLNRKMSNINFLNFDPPIEEFHQHYEPLVTTLIKGELNSTVFSSRALNEFHLGTVLTTDNPDLFINSIGLVSPVEEDSNPQPKADIAHVWKIFSAAPLSKEQILKLFVSYDYAVKQSWLACPHYTPPEKCPSIILHDRLYYLNGIEFAASAMEMSAIAGYNAALLAYHRWNGNTHMIDQEDLYERLKTELWNTTLSFIPLLVPNGISLAKKKKTKHSLNRDDFESDILPLSSFNKSN